MQTESRNICRTTIWHICTFLCNCNAIGWEIFDLSFYYNCTVPIKSYRWLPTQQWLATIDIWNIKAKICW